jgi:hypothetical protein
MDTARMPSLQFAEIQTRRVEADRRPAEHVCSAAGSLHVLLAPLLLVYVPWRASAVDPRLIQNLEHFFGNGAALEFYWYPTHSAEKSGMDGAQRTTVKTKML